MNFKMLAVDMDGTLLREDKTISDRTKKAIKKAITKGVSIFYFDLRNKK